MTQAARAVLAAGFLLLVAALTGACNSSPSPSNASAPPSNLNSTSPASMSGSPSGAPPSAGSVVV